MIESIPFTYLLKHIPTNKYYYGVRYKKGCHPKDLWTKYFTSSKKVKGLIKRYGKKSFIFEIRKIFKNPNQAINWENKVLKRIKAIYRDDFLNQTDNKCFDPILISKYMKTKIGIKNSFYGKKHSKKTIKKLRLINLGKNNPMYGKSQTEEVKQKIRLSKLGKNNPMYGKKGKNSPVYGKKHSKKTIQKMRLARLAYYKNIKQNKIDPINKAL
jgi:hypothetical protein